MSEESSNPILKAVKRLPAQVAFAIPDMIQEIGKLIGVREKTAPNLSDVINEKIGAPQPPENIEEAVSELVANLAAPGGLMKGGIGLAGTLVKMPPLEFLRLAAPFKHAGGPDVNRNTVEFLKANPDKITGQYLTVKRTPSGDLQVGLHDGRHRALAASELGFTTIPVDIRKGMAMNRKEPNLTDEQLINLIADSGLLPEITK